MEQMARAVAGVPRLLLRALFVVSFVGLWLVLSNASADAAGRDHASDPRAAQAVAETAASTRAAVDDGPQAADPVGDAVREVEETGRRATDEAVAVVEDAARQAGDEVDEGTARVRSVVQETTRDVTEAVESVAPVIEPLPALPHPARDHHGEDLAQGSARASAVHNSLTVLEDPTLLVLPTAPASDPALTVVGAGVPTAAGSPVGLSPQTAPGHASDDTPAVPSGSGPLLPTPAQAARPGDAGTPTDLDLVRVVPERALIPPAQRATSPGTTPD